MKENSIEEDIKIIDEMMKEKSMEEEIKILDEMILNCRYKHNYYDEYAEKKAKVLEKCKKALKENEEYYKQLDLDYVENNFISKQRIEYKIEEIKARMGKDCIVLHEFQREAKIDVLQELLEGRK